MAIPSYDQIRTIPGWLTRVDFQMFQFILAAQSQRQLRGDLAELGVYLGKSAAVIGGCLEPGETFTVVDLFRSDTGADAANAAEQAREYAGLQRDQFERHYLSVHDRLPVVVEGLSHTIADHAAAGAHRFVHIDASHLYSHVRRDIEVARELLLDDGVVVLDDIRAPHTPGVAAAGWQAAAAGMHPIAISGEKLYATWGDTDQWRAALASWLPASGLNYESQEVAGQSLFRVWGPPHPVQRLSGLARRAVTIGLTGVSKARVRYRHVTQGAR